ncbi:MAG: hypothetical protein JJU11_09800, partial [Candidatus Sumerlaeia bacterium]|nr:hypothetical protein [Candidatus Sumerlaeia bacterium]
MIFTPKKVLPLILLWILASFSMVEAQRTTHGYSRDDGWRPEHGEAQRLAQWDRLAKDGLQKGSDEAIVVGPATVDASASQALIVGTRIAVGEDLDLSGILQAATKGGGELGRGTVTVDSANDLIVWSAHLIVQGAGASSIILKGLDLPQGVELWAYTAHGFVDGPVTTTGNAGSGSHWTSPLPGESLYIELRLPADLDPSTIGSHHGTISHAGWFDPVFFGTDPLGKGPCPGNADCIISGECVDESDFTHLEDLRRAVALIVYPSGEGFGACTGTLIATTDPDDPDSYLLTANHCFEEQDAADELRVFYDFRKSSCDAETCPGINFSNADQMGATIVHTAAQQDVTLVRLNSTPPGDRYFVGWTNEQFAEEDGMIVHRLSHPNATAQAYSRHEIRPNEVSCGGAPVGQYVYNKVVFGATDQGSSGSVIVTSDNLIIGQNRGRCGPPGATNDPCNDAALNFDGALAAYYDDVKEFLDPDGIVEPSPTPTATPSPTPTETPTPTPTPEPTPTPTPEPTPTPTPDPTPTPTPEPTPTPTPEPTPTPTPEPTPTP